MTYLIAAVVVVGIAYFVWKMTSRSGYESAEYTLIEADGAFELRDYPDLMLVATSMKFQQQGNDGSFGRLFRYISGANADGRKIAMTTPVFMEPDGQRAGGQMGFVIPREIVEDKIPGPAGEAVQIQKRAGGQFAVFRFAGRMNNETRTKANASLREWLASKGLEGQDGEEFAGYDPPWTPGPLRRNEILVRLDINRSDDP